MDGETIYATASIGVSVIVDPRQDLAKLITLADQALYLAKARGRNRVEVAPIEVDADDDAPQRADSRSHRGAQRRLIASTIRAARAPDLRGRRRHVDD